MYYPESYQEELRKTTTNLMISGVPAEIRAEHLPNISLQRYRYTCLLDTEVST
jgi:hypothetical protein